MSRRSLAAACVGALALTGAPTAAQSARIPPRDEQIAAAVLPLPPQLRAPATVLGYGANGKLIVLRKGTGDMTCLAHNPNERSFHVACYHNSLEPFMARGRALRDQGVKDPQVDTVRFAEAKSGKLKLPSGPASLYQLFGGTFDPKLGTVTGAQALYVVYIPYATGATTGLSERPIEGGPWLMYPGTPKAHIMYTPKM
jgi:hypothetical protein